MNFWNIQKFKTNISINITAIPLWVVVMFFLFSVVSCKKEAKETVALVFNPDSTYTMKATDVSSLISDSGITQYRMTAKEWLMFDKAAEPYWYFPKKIYVEKFDTLFNTEASIEADTAYYYSKKSLWKLVGNVHVENLQGEKFETSLLYWDQKKELIYSDQFIRIEQEGQVVLGVGFESNQDMSQYEILDSKGSFDIDENTKEPDSLQQKGSEPVLEDTVRQKAVVVPEPRGQVKAPMQSVNGKRMQVRQDTIRRAIPRKQGNNSLNSKMRNFENVRKLEKP